MLILIEQVLYIDPQQAAAAGECEKCGGALYGAESCPRCGRRGQ